MSAGPHRYEARIQKTEWQFADYSLVWNPETRILSYCAEGQDNPKDLWGFEASYPPRIMDEVTLHELAEIFGQNAVQKVKCWLDL